MAEVLKIDDDALCRVEFNEITKIRGSGHQNRAPSIWTWWMRSRRAALDRLVGYKISPLLWAKVKKACPQAVCKAWPCA